MLVEVEAGNDLMTDEFQDLQSNVNNFFKNVSKESFFDDADTTQSTNPENSQIQPQNAPIEHVTPQIDIRDSLELQVQNDYPNVPSYSPANPQFISLESGAEFGATTPSLPESEGNTWSVLDVSISGDSLHGIQAQRRLRAVDTPSTVFSYFIQFSLNFYVFAILLKNCFFIREADEPLNFESPNPLGLPLNSSTPLIQQQLEPTGGPIRNSKTKPLSRIHSFRK